MCNYRVHNDNNNDWRHKVKAIAVYFIRGRREINKNTNLVD